MNPLSIGVRTLQLVLQSDPKGLLTLAYPLERVNLLHEPGGYRRLSVPKEEDGRGLSFGFTSSGEIGGPFFPHPAVRARQTNRKATMRRLTLPPSATLLRFGQYAL